MLSCLLLVSSLVPSHSVAAAAAPRPEPAAMVRAAITEISDVRSLASGSLTDAVGQALSQLRAERSSSLTHR